MGFEKVEVIDDGHGIHSTNFDALCNFQIKIISNVS